MYRMKDFTLPLLLEYASKGEFHIADQTRRHPLAVEMATPDPSGKIGHQHQGIEETNNAQSINSIISNAII